MRISDRIHFKEDGSFYMLSAQEEEIRRKYEEIAAAKKENEASLKARREYLDFEDGVERDYLSLPPEEREKARFEEYLDVRLEQHTKHREFKKKLSKGATVGDVIDILECYDNWRNLDSEEKSVHGSFSCYCFNTMSDDRPSEQDTTVK